MPRNWELPAVWLGAGEGQGLEAAREPGCPEGKGSHQREMWSDGLKPSPAARRDAGDKGQGPETGYAAVLVTGK